MNDSLLLMQVLFEIAMSIGNSLDLDVMLQESVSNYLRKLNCLAGCVLTLEKVGDDKSDDSPHFHYTKHYSIPRDIYGNKACQAAMKQIPKQLSGSQLDDFLRTLPLRGESNGTNFHIMELPDFGLLLLLKSGIALEKPVIQSLKRLNLKLARSAIACLNNREVHHYNRQLKDEMRQRRQMEEQLLQARKMEAIGTLAGGVAHDFNNLLSIILGNISLAMVDVEPGQSYSPRLDDVEEATMKARDLANKFITFSSGGKPILYPAGSLEFLEEIVENDLSSKPFDLRIHAPGEISRVNIDKIQMRQVVLNIIENAVEAQSGNEFKRVDVTVRNVRVDNASTGHQVPAGHYVVIGILDKGVGIPQEQLPKIFDPYYSTKRMGSRKGTGLGLSIAHSIVQKHAGYLVPLSKPEQGTTMNIYLPALDKLPVEPDHQLRGDTPQSKPVTSPTPAEKKHILVMDDEPQMLDMLGKMTSMLGYNVTKARNGNEAIELYSRSMGSEEPIDAVILDLTIKNGMSGEQGIKQLLELDPGVVAVASSGQTDNPMLTAFDNYGFKGALEKPFSMGKLREVLKTVLKNKN